MNMILTVRDNVASEGQNNRDTMIVTVDGASGPFEVTSQSTAVSWDMNTTETITWNVANTTAAPVNAANVDIFLSIDGGLTYPYTLATGVPNNGSANITVPLGSSTSQARIMVRGAANIFYALNISNFNITTTVGLDELNLDALSIYPNPNKGIINLDFGSIPTIDKITIFDAQGKVVLLDENIATQKKQFNISHLANGIYKLQIQNNKGVSIHKIIKE